MNSGMGLCDEAHLAPLLHGTCWDVIVTSGTDKPACPMRPVPCVPHLPPRGLCAATDGHSVRSDRDEGTLVPWYLLINGTEPRWRLHNTVDSADLEQSLARVKETGVTTYTLASRNEGETFQSLTINGKNLDRYLITQENDPDPAKTQSRYEAAGF